MKKVQLVAKPIQEPVIVRRTVKYGACNKNFAVHLGGRAIDGCKEFVAGGTEGTDPALTCATCGCHRSFHKRSEEITEVVREGSAPTASGSNA